MARPFVVLVDPDTGRKIQTYNGFCWEAALWSPYMWCLSHGMMGMLTSLVLYSIFTAGFLIPFIWIVFPFVAFSNQYKYLVNIGWIPEGEYEQRFDPSDPEVDLATFIRCPSCKEIVRRDASVCKFCRADLVPSEFNPKRAPTNQMASSSAVASEAKTSSGKKFCTKCGTGNAEARLFCSECGEKFL